MPVSREQKRFAEVHLMRTIVTLPFLIAMMVSLFPLFTNTANFVKAHFAWRDVEAEVMVVTSDTSYFRYRHEKDKTFHTGSVTTQKVLWCIPFGEPPHENDSVKIAYNPSKPTEYVVYHKIYCSLLTWGIIEILAFFLYFDLDARMKEHIRKTTNIRLTG